VVLVVLVVLALVLDDIKPFLFSKRRTGACLSRVL
jgi:hypothetical protein